jgi:hypothetical protein
MPKNEETKAKEAEAKAKAAEAGTDAEAGNEGANAEATTRTRGKATGSKKLYANLVLGKVYIYKGKRFTYNNPIEVSEEVGKYLKACKIPVERLTNTGKGKKNKLVHNFAVGPNPDDLLDIEEEDESADVDV